MLRHEKALLPRKNKSRSRWRNCSQLAATSWRGTFEDSYRCGHDGARRHAAVVALPLLRALVAVRAGAADPCTRVPRLPHPGRRDDGIMLLFCPTRLGKNVV